MTQLTFGDILGEDEPTKPLTTLKAEGGRQPSWYTGRVLSHSSVNLYKTCPQKWKFKYVDKVPELPRPYFAFGKSVHTGLEFLFEGCQPGEPQPDGSPSGAQKPVPQLEDVLAYYKLKWIREGYDTVSQERFFYQEGERILKGFYAKHSQEFKKVFKVELRFEFDVEGVPVMGFIDRIDVTPAGGLAIIDYKTGKAFDKSRVRKDPQLTLYQMAVEQLLGKKVESLTLYHLNSLTPLTVDPHTPEMSAQVRAGVVETAQGISAGKFDPVPDAKGHCQWCDYAQICPAFAGKPLPSASKIAVPTFPPRVNR